MRRIHKSFALFLVLLSLCACKRRGYHGGHAAPLTSTSSRPNAVGLWLWRIERTTLQSHQQLAQKMRDLGINRLYMKTADGVPDRQKWPNGWDTAIPELYHAHGIEVFAWSWNYADRPAEGQAEAIENAAQAGYDGFVLDTEKPFSGKDVELEALLKAFREKRDNSARKIPLFVTTLGRPDQSDLNIKIMDKYADALMPQMYFEEWNHDTALLRDVPGWIKSTLRNFRCLGATKPLYPIYNAADPKMKESAQAVHAQTFQEFVGPNASFWRVPGDGLNGQENPDDARAAWNILEKINWRQANFPSALPHDPTCD